MKLIPQPDLPGLAVSDGQEQLKVIAKRTGTIVFIASQISRPDKSNASVEVKLHDGKDSGSLENSSGLVLGVWRPQPDTITIRVLKNTKGASGRTIECHYDGAKMQIREKPKDESATEKAVRSVHPDP